MNKWPQDFDGAHHVAHSEGTASAQRINEMHDEDEADNDVRGGMQMLGCAVLLTIGVFVISGAIAALIYYF